MEIKQEFKPALKEQYCQKDIDGEIVCQIFIRDGYTIELPELFVAKKDNS